MSLFKKPTGGSSDSPEPDGSLPVTVFDLSKRYGLYCSTPSEDRLYEDVRIIGIRTFERKKHDYGTALIGGYIEIETHNGTRTMIRHLSMYMLCEHGAQPDFKVLRIRKSDLDA